MLDKKELRELLKMLDKAYETHEYEKLINWLDAKRISKFKHSFNCKSVGDKDSEDSCKTWCGSSKCRIQNEVEIDPRIKDFEIAQAGLDYLKKVGSVDNKDAIFHDFQQGCYWLRTETEKRNT